jgi:hypothetical protein
MPGGFPRGKQCCCDGDEEVTCEYFSDDFTRGDSSSLGSDWTETAGDWEISSNTLITGDDDAICLCNTDHPDGSQPLICIVKMVHGKDNDNLQMILGYEDASNYTYVNAQRLNGDLIRLRIYEKTAGSDSQEDTADFSHTEGDPLWVKACWTGAAVQVETSTDGSTYTARVSAGITSTDTTCGVGTGSIGNIDAVFDDFSLSRHEQHTAGCEGCSLDCARCSDAEPYQFQVVISGLAAGDADCTSVNGTWVLDQVSGCEWQSARQAYSLDGGCSGNMFMILRIIAADSVFCGDGGSYTLVVHLAGDSGLCTQASCGCFRHSQVATYDCDDLSSLNVPLVAGDCDFFNSGGGAGCDNSSATCTVTAL